jgi:hypothetical protein
MRQNQRWKRSRVPKGGPDYHQLWRIVDGAVADAFAMHPDYLTQHGHARARQSIVKRVVGNVLSYADQVSAQGRSGLGQRLNSR